MAFTDIKNVAITDLLLDKDNYRYFKGTVTTQEECVAEMLENYEIENLADEIAKNGWSEFEQVVVFKIDGNNWTVMEGNRRITALKLLNDPALCKDQDKQRIFADLKSKYAINIPNQITIYTDNLEKIKYHIKKRHSGPDDGRGTLPWDPLRKDNQAIDNKAPLNYPFVHKLGGGAPALVSKIQKKGFPVSTLERILAYKEIRHALNIETRDDGTLTIDKHAEDIFQKIITALDNKDLNVDHVKTQELAKEYFKDKFKIIFKDTTESKRKMNQASPRKGKARLSGVVKNKRIITVIPEHTSQFVPDKHEKAKKIMNELRGLDIKKFTQAGAISLRCFIELSVYHYVEDKKLPVVNTKKLDRHGNPTKKTLHDLLIDVCNDLESKNLIKKSDKQSATSSRLKISDLNAFVHNPNALPAMDELTTTWLAIKIVLEKCWTS
ncbi:MAG: hypothetical protein QM529_06085 [Hydrotalea sp.]|nr:hypothetical protein [Hydrotalea sp.]